jgi:hypothetical protein
MSDMFLKDGRKHIATLALGAALGAIMALAPLGVAPATAQTNAEVAELLRVEWQPTTETWRRPSLTGFLYNDSTYRIGSVRLRVEALDGANQVLSETLAWTYVNVSARSRGAFTVPRPKVGETFRITVESFVLIARESPLQSP